MKVITDENKIDELLNRGVQEVFTREELKKKLPSDIELNILMETFKWQAITF